MKIDYEKLTRDLALAKNATFVTILDNTEDGGTCNFDAPVLFVKNARIKELEKAAANAGVRISKWGDGYYHIYGNFLCGQGDLRTRCAEAFAKSLKNSGWDTSVYYAMD